MMLTMFMQHNCFSSYTDAADADTADASAAEEWRCYLSQSLSLPTAEEFRLRLHHLEMK